ncbi:sulfate/thiosulfate ABC transporter permease CysT [Candidatus Blochmannia vicinus (nom. nud.)]|uniref:Sulfate transport system permease protein CysT n=1 Tax=Candidatus Blochmannia vicinus (nom. nud.) TaxID=251540 RepID=A0A9Q8X2M8_9ENTR|nr:sulfate/thiosulfate ABC transporter permease CysT [Candidatus Blochmannia vicinus]URJ28266.1 sulfate/thiosulfate ABC transporter permease CysT [Candidatus Blochmannia vicinus]URJ30458.1 sulfate/thiosulfate ABC transporter permease CysT [Candidatus Blochmannia vicinus]
MLFFSVKYVLPGFGIALGSSLLFVCLILLLPLSALVMQLSQMNVYQYWDIITDPALLVSYKITLLSAGLATLFNAVFGMLVSWVITRYRFPGKKLLDALIDLPFALPTAVAGLTLATLFSTSGWYGSWLSRVGITVSYTWIGISIAMIFTSIPFVVRTVQPVLEEFSEEYEEVAKTLGADYWQIFYNIIFPELAPAWLSGVVLSFIRSLGEFGAVIFIAGNIAWKNEVISLIIFIRLQEFDYPAASAIASVILMISLLLLLFTNMFQLRINRRFKGF